MSIISSHFHNVPERNIYVRSSHLPSSKAKTDSEQGKDPRAPLPQGKEQCPCESSTSLQLGLIDFIHFTYSPPIPKKLKCLISPSWKKSEKLIFQHEYSEMQQSWTTTLCPCDDVGLEICQKWMASFPSGRETKRKGSNNSQMKRLDQKYSSFNNLSLNTDFNINELRPQWVLLRGVMP